MTSKLSFDPKNPVPCKWCGTPTPSLGTKMCDRCWELDRRISADPVLAARILVTTTQHINKE